jgi:hypothetical protein
MWLNLFWIKFKYNAQFAVFELFESNLACSGSNLVRQRVRLKGLRESKVFLLINLII